MYDRREEREREGSPEEDLYIEEQREKSEIIHVKRRERIYQPINKQGTLYSIMLHFFYNASQSGRARGEPPSVDKIETFSTPQENV
jgi:hypothetical protein